MSEQPPLEPWCRECGVFIADKDAHDRWHDRAIGTADPKWEPMCQCGGPANHCVGPR
jgi:hypothetical protein